MDSLDQARMLFQRALEHHNQQRFVQAESLYRQALELVPDRPSVLVNLSAVLIAQDRHAEATEFCRRALEIEPGNREAREHSDLCRRASDSADDQLRKIEEQLRLEPENAAAHNNRALILHDLERYADAIAGFERAHRLDPGNPLIMLNRGRSNEAFGRHRDALRDYSDALSILPDLDRAGHGFARVLTLSDELPDAGDVGFDQLLARAIERPWIAPQLVVPIILRRLRQKPLLAAILSGEGKAWDTQRSEAKSADSSDEVIFGTALQIALLRNAVIFDPDFERLFTGVRRQLLASTHADPEGNGAPGSEAMSCALAMQCFLNEYVYDVGTDEANASNQLERLLSAALERGNHVPPRLIAAVACYRPLHSIAHHERLLDLDTPPALADLIRQQVAEPLQERRLAAHIPRLTPIRDAVSSGVRRQYEENPYPRWSSLPTDLVKLSFPDYLKRRLPTVDIGRVPGQPGARIHALNAGCGTGQHPSNMALRIESMHLLAVDLSLSSLAHATRKAKELELSNVAFAQADILEIGRLPTRYDLIESIGVLHHLADPSVGLGVLCHLLNDGGIIRLGLYSELGRRSIVACRDDIQRRGLRSDPDAIRQYRSELRQLDSSDPRKGATRFADFYSLSECRDLLFHVHERRFTVRTLQFMLESHDLEFLGFDLEPDQIASFRRSHPDPSSLADFDAWDIHERSYPDTFSRMYMAWARKRHRSSAPALPPGARNNGINPR